MCGRFDNGRMIFWKLYSVLYAKKYGNCIPRQCNAIRKYFIKYQETFY